MKTQYQGPQGQLQLYFGNKSTKTLERLLCNVPPSPQFAFQMAALPPSIEPKKQVQASFWLRNGATHEKRSINLFDITYYIYICYNVLHM